MRPLLRAGPRQAAREIERLHRVAVWVEEGVRIAFGAQRLAQLGLRPILVMCAEIPRHELAKLNEALAAACHVAAKRAVLDRAAIDAVAVDALAQQPVAPKRELPEAACRLEADALDERRIAAGKPV